MQLRKLSVLFAALPFWLSATDPVFYMPMDGSADVLGKDGKKISAGIVHGQAAYHPGVIGQALDVKRHAYDQVTALTFTRLPEQETGDGTVSFWFKPHWKETDPEQYPIFTGRDDQWKFRFYLIKQKNGVVELSVCAPGQVQILKKNLFKTEEWNHVAFTWIRAKNEARLYINGREAGNRTRPGAYQKLPPRKLNFYCGQESTDRFKATVGNGLYDEIKFFDRALDPAEIFLLASGGKKEKKLSLPLDSIRRKGEGFELAFRYPEARLPGPKQLLVLSGADSGKKFTLSAMGASGRIALIAENGGKTQTVESCYTLPLNVPHKITLRQDGKTLTFLLDDAFQGKFTMPTPFGKIVRAEGAEGLTLTDPEKVPSREETARLSAKTIRPLEKGLWDLSDAQKTQDGVRSGVCLNGYWRVIPVNDFSWAPPAGEWGYMRVPGSFRSPLYQIYRDRNGKLVSANWKWNEQPLIKYRAGWYQRVFDIPADLRKRGGRIYLNFTNLNADAGRVYLNGKLIDDFRQDFKNFPAIPNARRLDVTDLLGKDGKNVLTLFLDRNYTGLWQGVPSIGDHEEIALDDVWLEQAPSKIALKSAVAFPSFRKKSLSLRARVQNPAGEKGECALRFDFQRNGKTEKSSIRKFTLDGSPEQVILFTDSWKNPVLWDVENPNLYRMSVSLLRNGKTVDTFPAKDFGFREFWVENGEFRMNGNKTRLRMWTSPGLGRVRYYYGNPRAIGQYVAHIKEMNYDTVRFDPFRKGSQVAWDDYLNESNRQGLYNLFQMPPYEDEELTGYTREVTRFLEHYGNHPNILMWYTDFNTCGYAWGQDPAKLNDTSYVPLAVLPARKRAQTAEKVMRALDPSRELFQHAGANSGKIFTSMNYQSLGTPLQEQEDWPKQWSEKHTQPLMVVESAFPYPAQFWHFETGTLSHKGFELGAEHAARYFGDAVFAREARPVPHADHWLNSPYANWNRNMFDLGAMLYRNVVKAWRAYDMSALGDFPGERDMARTARTYNHHNVVYEVDNNVKTAGLKPDIPVGWSETQKHLLTDYSQPEGLDKIIRSSFEPLLIFLGGMPEDFTNKDHAFFSGEKFRKSAVIVNDRTTPQTVTCRWELAVDGRTVQQGESTQTAAPGAILKVPIPLTAPKVYKRTDAELRLMALKNDVLILEDSFRLQFFPKHVRPAFRDIAAGLYDPDGDTEAMLKQAGFPFRTVRTLDDLKKCRLLIIGKNALKESNPDLLKQMEKARLVERGLKVLIFEQQPCNLANLVFESPSYRNAFLRRPESPYVAGLKEEDFSNWRGAADSVPAFVLSAENSPHYPRSKWKCGNGGIVSGNVIRKPSYGNFRTIVDCGFNLMFASLMELRKEHGIVLFCQLDVTNRYGKDPAATRLVDNLLTEMGKRFVPIGPQRVGYLGDAKNETILKRMGMNYRKLSADRLWEIGNEQILILGADPVPENRREALKKALARGRTIVALPGAPLELLPGGLKRGTKELFRASVPKNDPVFAGIPEADLYFREARSLPVLVSAPDWTIATQPALFAKLDRITDTTVVMNLSPDAIGGLWNPEKVARIWSAIFTNMNIGLGRDLQLFTAQKSRHNTLRFCFGKAVPENCGLRFDPENNGKVDDPKGFVPIKLGLSWEAQGHQQPNPHYTCPPETPKNLKRPYDGYAWYRCTVKIPESWKGHTIRLVGGPVDDCDWTYWNGSKIGETTFRTDPKCYEAKRNYRIPEKLVKFGAENTLVIRVFDRWGNGGVTGPFSVIAEDANASDAWSPYIDKLDFYDVDAFHNW